MVRDNGTQFTDIGFREMLASLQITHHFASVSHPQSNGKAKATNEVIVEGLLKRCQASGSNWVENLFQVL
jgi:transposase InsO family protein